MMQASAAARSTVFGLQVCKEAPVTDVLRRVLFPGHFYGGLAPSFHVPRIVRSELVPMS